MELLLAAVYAKRVSPHNTCAVCAAIWERPSSSTVRDAAQGCIAYGLGRIFYASDDHLLRPLLDDG
ncbi:hypothetical protein E4U55_003247 [Claviceps digitariae]|nr:hypothetical protein E4U55_003247 [Claviceps digitariae]